MSFNNLLKTTTGWPPEYMMMQWLWNWIW